MGESHLFVFGLFSVVFAWFYAGLNPEGYCVLCYGMHNNLTVDEAYEAVFWLNFSNNLVVTLSVVVGVVCLFLALFFWSMRKFIESDMRRLVDEYCELS